MRLRAIKEFVEPLSVSLVREQAPEALDYIKQYVDIRGNSFTLLATATPFNVQILENDSVHDLINLKPVNEFRSINPFFEAVNSKLQTHALFIGCYESKNQHKKRIFAKYPFPASFLYYYLFDFPWKRVFPKVKGLDKIYERLSRDQNQVVTSTEILGRLISSGFRICNYQEYDGATYFCAEKTGTPVFDKDPTFGPLIKLNRLGKDGKMIKVYKMRTMHPYSEYLQEYIYEHYDLQEGGKFNNDFRITNWGKIMRKLWLDELPMLFNWLKGDLKLVGVRPLSRHYSQLYPEKDRQRRLQAKPGLLPPFYADMPATLDEVIESEKNYLDQYEKHPFKTDFIYFWKIMYNILVKRERSN
jgi:lipopolysaccharide/colanic/teichoic acid biosynthesis glycosyltransferase